MSNAIESIMHLFYYLYIIVYDIFTWYTYNAHNIIILVTARGGQGNIRKIKNNNNIRTRANEFQRYGIIAIAV